MTRGGSHCRRDFGHTRDSPRSLRDSGRALAHPNRRRRVRGLEGVEVRVFSVGKLRGSDSLQIRRGVLRVRILLAPPFSLLLRRLPARTRAQPEKSPRFRQYPGSWPNAWDWFKRRRPGCAADGETFVHFLRGQLRRFGLGVRSFETRSPAPVRRNLVGLDAVA